MKPRYDRDRRRLMLGRRVVKDFRTPANNQVRIVEAFEARGWPLRIGDPLPPPEYTTCRKLRLHDAVKRLNGNQVNKLIRFHGDGTGEGIWWELIQ